MSPKNRWTWFTWTRLLTPTPPNNVLFREKSGEDSPAQIKAFTDTWEWTLETERAFEQDIILHPGTPAAVKEMIAAFRQFIGRNAMLAYLVMMTPRLVELRRILKPTGSLYLHCDPTASHYLKILLDAVFGARNFRNEIVWRRYSSHGNVSRNLGRVHDVIFRYSKTKKFVWNQLFRPLREEYVEKFFHKVEPETGRRYQSQNVLNPNADRPNLTYDWNGYTRVWKWSRERMQQLHAEGRLEYSRTGYPRLKQYLDESLGERLQDIWDDLAPVGQSGEEVSLGYDTQKPMSLLERIIRTSSNEGDVVLDPFCGCGTAVAAAQKLNRQWLGIDITHLAVALMKSRLKTAFDLEPGRDYAVVGEPRDAGSARALWEQDPYQFQFWAVSLLEAQPYAARVAEQKRGADQGIDGIIYFVDGLRREPQKVVVQVKGGRVSSPQIRDLKGVVEREKAALGLFISLEEPTRDMRKEEAGGGFYRSDLWQRDFPKIQLRTIDELLAGHSFDLPPRQLMYQPAERVRSPEGEQGELGVADFGLRRHEG